jgi:hypothetical protein
LEGRKEGRKGERKEDMSLKQWTFGGRSMWKDRVKRVVDMIKVFIHIIPRDKPEGI